jgi:hypothetical protein
MPGQRQQAKQVLDKPLNWCGKTRLPLQYLLYRRPIPVLGNLMGQMPVFAQPFNAYQKRGSCWRQRKTILTRSKHA